MPKSAGSDSISGKDGSSGRQYRGEVRWTLLDLDQIADAYRASIAPAMRADGFDPEAENPTYEWLNDNGYRKFIYALREYHDLTVQQFCEDVLEIDRSADEGYDWGIEDDDTRESMAAFVDRRLEHRDGYGESTAETHRYRLARYARAHFIQHGTDDLLAPVAPDSDVSDRAAIDQAWAALDAIKTELAETTAYRIYSIADEWYTYLISRGIADQNPLAGIDREYGWESGTPSSGDPSALEAGHVRALVDVASDVREQLLVVGLCAWGLRSGEIAALHRDQLVLDEDEPYIRFDERKNGPGQVNLVYGVEVARQRMAELFDREDWNGYLFPSTSSATGHRDESTIRRWFHDLADEAGVPTVIDGDDRKPHMGRRFWYDAYNATLMDILEHAEEIAKEQGSESARVVLDSYLDEDRKRSLRREFMRQRLADVFEES